MFRLTSTKDCFFFTLVAVSELDENSKGKKIKNEKRVAKKNLSRKVRLMRYFAIKVTSLSELCKAKRLFLNRVWIQRVFVSF